MIHDFNHESAHGAEKASDPPIEDLPLLFLSSFFRLLWDLCIVKNADILPVQEFWRRFGNTTTDGYPSNRLLPL